MYIPQVKYIQQHIDLLVLLYLNKELPTAMTQQLMESNLHLKRRPFPFDVQVLQA